MTFADIPNGASVFVDANPFVYAFAPHVQFAPPSSRLLKRVEHGEFAGFTSSAVLSDVAHRLMTLEACAAFSWPYAGIASRLKKHPAQLQLLARFRQAVDDNIGMGFQVLPSRARHVAATAVASQNFGLLSNDTPIVVLMEDNQFVHLASHDADFDRVPNLTRYAPI